MDNIQLVETLLAKPYMYTCGESLTALEAFLHGYGFCRIEYKIAIESEPKYSLLPAEWELFTDFIRCSLTYDEPLADWYDILMTYFGDREGYRMFVNYFDSFRRLQVTSYKRAALNDEQKKSCMENTGINTTVPQNCFIVSLNRGECFMSAVEVEDEVWQTRHIYKTEEAAIEDAVKLFGSGPAWFGVTGVEELSFKKPVRSSLYIINKE